MTSARFSLKLLDHPYSVQRPVRPICTTTGFAKSSLRVTLPDLSQAETRLTAVTMVAIHRHTRGLANSPGHPLPSISRGRMSKYTIVLTSVPFQILSRVRRVAVL